MAVGRLLFLRNQRHTGIGCLIKKELCRAGPPCSHQIGLDQGRGRDLAYAALLGAQFAAVGDARKPAMPRGARLVDEVLHPGESWRCPSAVRRYASARRRPCRNQSESLKGGLAIT